MTAALPLADFATPPPGDGDLPKHLRQIARDYRPNHVWTRLILERAARFIEQAQLPPAPDRDAGSA